MGRGPTSREGLAGLAGRAGRTFARSYARAQTAAVVVRVADRCVGFVCVPGSGYAVDAARSTVHTLYKH